MQRRLYERDCCAFQGVGQTHALAQSLCCCRLVPDDGTEVRAAELHPMPVQQHCCMFEYMQQAGKSAYTRDDPITHKFMRNPCYTI